MRQGTSDEWDIRELSPATPAMMEFIQLPSRLQGSDPNWVPPLLMERRAALSPARNPLFQHVDAAFFLASRNGRGVGRISAQIDRLEGTGIGHFGLLAAEPDAGLVHALLASAEQWLRGHGCQEITGPFNLSINEETGLLIKGHDTPPMLMMGHDPDYLTEMVESFGYAKERDLFAYTCATRGERPKELARIVARPLPGNIRIRPLAKARYTSEIRLATEIFNDAWSENWGFVPLTEAEMDHMAVQMKPLVQERLVWFAEIDEVPVGFVVCLPNLNEAIADLGGRLLPFGWVNLLWRLKVTGVKSARVPLMGIRKSVGAGLIGSVIAAHLIEAIRREALALSIERLEMSWILEDNLPMRRLAEALGGRAYKTYRVYRKSLR